ncbi:MAG: methyltransferase domain-containing protein [Selenomonadaceae bacterium]|nr:methyltransferase domain-containing protein [Selenomonadaceae bacterium]
MTSKVEYVSRDDLLKKAFDSMYDVESILDIGCGIVPHDYVKSKYYICCEPYTQYVSVLKEKLKNNTNSFYIVKNIDWEQVNNEFKEKSVDTIFLIDVIEHLEKNYGRKLLEKTVKIAKKQVIIFTPLSYIEQKTLDGKDAWGLNGADWQEHKSVWTPNDFDDSWECIVSKDYHKYNNIGELLDEPVGAFFAIKNVNEFDDKVNTFTFNKDECFVDNFISLNNLNKELEKKIIEKNNECEKWRNELMLSKQYSTNLENENEELKKELNLIKNTKWWRLHEKIIK